MEVLVLLREMPLLDPHTSLLIFATVCHLQIHQLLPIVGLHQVMIVLGMVVDLAGVFQEMITVVGMVVVVGEVVGETEVVGIVGEREK
jgi:hypothetical protein